MVGHALSTPRAPAAPPMRWPAIARHLRGELDALRLVYRDPRTPRYAKWLLAGTLAYALSPIDLIPDFIPVLGHVDDLLIVPAALWLSLRLIPREVLADCRARAAEAADG